MTRGALADRVPVPVLTVDRDGVVVSANDAAHDYFDEHAVDGANLSNVVLEHARDRFDALLDTATESTAGSSTERVPFGFGDRTHRPDVTATPVEGGVELVVDTISECERYARLVEGVGDPMYVLDVDGYVEMVNDAIVDEYGYVREDIVGKHATELMPEDAYERGTELIREMIAGDADAATLEFQAEGADGERRWAEVNLGILTDADGAYDGVVGVIRDVSERKRRARELAAFETIAEAAPVGMFTVDEQGTLTWANRRLYERVEMTRDELVGRPFTELADAGFVDWEMLEHYLDFLPELLSSKNDVERVDHEEVLHIPSGEDVIVEAHTTLLPLDDDDEFAGTVNAFRDITQRKAYREELERQNERLEAFASAVSHDLRNPLNVANGHLELARDRHPDDPSLAEVAHSHDRMSELIDDILSLARQGEAVGETESVELATTAKRAWATVSTDGAVLDVRTDATIVGDESRVRQLFENCFRNSREHGVPANAAAGTSDDDQSDAATSDDDQSDAVTSDDDQSVTVTVGETPDGFFVADDGPGLPEDVDVFEPGATTNEHGTGLGLSIVKEIANAHGWTVTAGASESGGARFDVAGTAFADDDASAHDGDDANAQGGG